MFLSFLNIVQCKLFVFVVIGFLYTLFKNAKNTIDDYIVKKTNYSFKEKQFNFLIKIYKYIFFYFSIITKLAFFIILFYNNSFACNKLLCIYPFVYVLILF